MRIEIKRAKERRTVKRQCPWACKIVKVHEGWMCFESWDDFKTWKNAR